MAIKGADIDAVGLISDGPKKEIPLAGVARVETESIEISTEVTASDRDYLEALAFMEELVEVMVMPPVDENEPNLVTLMVNGVPQHVLAGHPIKIKRKFLEVLARAKSTKYRQVVARDSLSGETKNQMIPRRSPRHNFSVIADASPKGAAWLREVMSDPS